MKSIEDLCEKFSQHIETNITFQKNCSENAPILKTQRPATHGQGILTAILKGFKEKVNTKRLQRENEY